MVYYYFHIAKKNKHTVPLITIKALTTTEHSEKYTFLDVYLLNIANLNIREKCIILYSTNSQPLKINFIRNHAELFNNFSIFANIV